MTNLRTPHDSAAENLGAFFNSLTLERTRDTLGRDSGFMLVENDPIQQIAYGFDSKGRMNSVTDACSSSFSPRTGRTPDISTRNFLVAFHRPRRYFCRLPRV